MSIHKDVLPALVAFEDAAALGLDAAEMAEAVSEGKVRTVKRGDKTYLLGSDIDALSEDADPLAESNAAIRERVTSRRLQPGEDPNSYIRQRVQDRRL